MNPKGMPLHFTLLFPHGTFGWDPNTPHTKGKGRVTTREFYAYHLNQRDLHGDYLHLAKRLFQEWICMAWVTVESQRLNYQRQNQKALRADSYKNVKEAIEERRQDLAQERMECFRMTVNSRVWEERFCQVLSWEVLAGSMLSSRMEWPSAESTTSQTYSSP